MDKKFICEKLYLEKCKNHHKIIAEFKVLSSEGKTIYLCENCFNSFRKDNEIILKKNFNNELLISEKVFHSTSIVGNSGSARKFSWESKELFHKDNKNIWEKYEDILDLSLAWFYGDKQDCKIDKLNTYKITFDLNNKHRTFIFGLQGSPLYEYNHENKIIGYFNDISYEDLCLNLEAAEELNGLTKV
ncbi:MAG: hypothetical protein BV456_04635 [Thermoplasmata archaeon M8B2D]|nr:MAG: hypothetical protein BV456_04635 [Thermoplasmata archaeon M8B2D]